VTNINPVLILGEKISGRGDGENSIADQMGIRIFFEIATKLHFGGNK